MKQLVQNFKTGELKMEDVPTPVLKAGGILVNNYFSLIAQGTERTIIDLAQRSLVGKAKQRPDLVKQVIDKAKRDGIINTFQQVMNRLDAPTPLGYSCAGVVEAVSKDIDEFKVGDRVACAGAGYANHAEMVFVPKNLCVKIPENVDFESAAFVTIGAIALQGVRRAELTLGERVAVIGLGLVGQITAQLVKTNGCKVLGIDLDAEKVSLAHELGADCGVVREGNVHEVCEAFSDGIGVDAVIITAATTSNDPIELAAEIARDRGRIVVVGAVKMDVPRKPFYDKELDLRLSRSYGPGRYDADYEEKGIDYPIGYVRWTEKRNMEEFLSLVAQGKVNLRPIITHVFDFADALKAYDLIMGKTEEKYLGVLLKYNQDTKLESKVFLKAEGKGEGKERGERKDGREGRMEGWKGGGTKSEIQIGLIGAGNFAKSVLLPNLRKIPSVNIKAIASATGVTAKHVGEKFGCEYVTSNYEDLLGDSDIHAVVIATRHNLHSKIAVEALKAGKAVFVEKPLAITNEQLEEVIATQQATNGRIMVGFNRRFSPFTIEIKKLLSNLQAPLCINYRVNAGFIPKDNWVHDPVEGGGRIIGEVCHFVEFLQHIIAAQPIKVYAENVSGDNDNVFITISFKDGSVGTIGYLANGDKSFSKERIEIFGGGSVAVIDDFRRGEFIKNGKRTKLGSGLWTKQDKGHFGELKAFVEAIQNGTEMPIDFSEIVMTTLTTFKIIESLKLGTPVEIEPPAQYNNLAMDETRWKRIT